MTKTNEEFFWNFKVKLSKVSSNSLYLFIYLFSMKTVSHLSYIFRIIVFANPDNKSNTGNLIKWLVSFPGWFVLVFKKC